MAVITLTLGEYDPDLPPEEWTYDAAIDPRNRVLILQYEAQTYAPAGGHLILTETTSSGYGQAIDRTLERQFAANEMVGDGIWELLIIDDSIVDDASAAARAQAELAIQTQPQIQISFESDTEYNVGNIFRIRDDVEGIDAIVRVVSVSIQAVAPDSLRYQVQATTFIQPTIVDLITEDIRDRRRPASVRPITF